MKRRLGLICLFALAGPAQAFDCSKASTQAEKAICADPAAHAADEQLAKAYGGAIAEMIPSAKSAAASAQLRWIGERDNACADLGGAKFASCLARESLRRRAFLAAEPEAGPGAPGRLAPAFREGKAGKQAALLDVQTLRYPAPATPAERAFNAAVERAVGPLDPPGKDETGDAPWEYMRAMRLVYASPRLISAHLEGYNSTGGAHPNSFTADINVLVEEGREAKWEDLVDEKAAPRIFAFCLKSIRAEKKSRLGADAAPDDDLPKSVADATGKLDAWSFGPQAATVTYDPYALGAYAEGAYECVIPYAVLKPLAKPGFPLP